MIIPSSIEELAGFVEQDGKKVFLFVADWCGDCRISILPCQRLRQKILDLLLFE